MEVMAVTMMITWTLKEVEFFTAQFDDGTFGSQVAMHYDDVFQGGSQRLI